ncbi:hypothetical protein N7495_006697 [Penicillium taxi]|uniref:uncharacterized protein n=1 Tax=Penicillium taxi TaxID=168475 RepID=UPI002545141B|nr:uncharacterized protein N7495_006697 [Penicillium taxi]KAJ5895006.1 hypothetical protein N7495_006697 [Penicillium taxi]
MSPTSNNYTIHKVFLKRTRQACGTCRRKKARCPGEKPNCSLCQRLGQQCTYETQPTPNRPGTQKPLSGNGNGHGVEGNYSDPASIKRLQHIEQRLEEISSMLRSSIGNQESRADELSEALREYMPSRDDDGNEEVGISPEIAPSIGHQDMMA